MYMILIIMYTNIAPNSPGSEEEEFATHLTQEGLFLVTPLDPVSGVMGEMDDFLQEVVHYGSPPETTANSEQSDSEIDPNKV